MIGIQVLNEFAAVATRKLGRDWAEVESAIADALALVDPPMPLSLAVHEAARGLARSHGFSLYDALMLAAAIEAECDTLYTEDMQAGRKVGPLVIVNPFASPD